MLLIRVTVAFYLLSIAFHHGYTGNTLCFSILYVCILVRRRGFFPVVMFLVNPLSSE